MPLYFMFHASIDLLPSLWKWKVWNSFLPNGQLNTNLTWFTVHLILCFLFSFYLSQTKEVQQTQTNSPSHYQHPPVPHSFVLDYQTTAQFLLTATRISFVLTSSPTLYLQLSLTLVTYWDRWFYVSSWLKQRSPRWLIKYYFWENLQRWFRKSVECESIDLK